MTINLDQAKALCAIIEYGGYSQAALALHKSHSSIVYLIKNFEQNCGIEIFDRKKYRNSLTPAGRRVYIKSQEILAKVDELDQICSQLKNKWEASIKIVFDGILPFDPFLEIYKNFKTEKIPTIVQTYTDYLQDVEKTFYKLDADIMISIIPIEKKDLQSIYLTSLKSFLVAHKDHPIHKTNKRWTLNELHEFNFLTIRGTVNKLGLNTSDFEESASFYLSDFSFKKEALLKKMGFGWLPEHLIQNELKNKTLLPVKWERKSMHEIQPILYINKKNAGGKALNKVIENLK